jgi:hypothetical protein
MTDVNGALAGAKTSIDDLSAAAERCRDSWQTPRAPGKWSPSQIVEHVARALDESANVVAGEPSKFPTLPTFVRPIVRDLVFNRVVKKGTFPRARTTKAFNPTAGPATPAEARRRVEAAFVRFDEECRRRAAAGRKVDSGVFGTVTVEDYVRFQELHTRHHCKQMPVSTGTAAVLSERVT